MSRLATRAAAVLGAAACVFAGGLVATRGGDRPTAAASATAAPVRANVDPLTTVLGTAGQVEQLQHAVAVRPDDGGLTAMVMLPEALLSTPLTAGVLSPRTGGFTAVLEHRYGRLRTVVAAPDGALWLTTSNRDGHGKPVADDERVIRYLPAAGGGHSHL